MPHLYDFILPETSAELEGQTEEVKATSVPVAGKNIHNLHNGREEKFTV